MDIEYLALKIIRLEEKLGDPNEETFLVEYDDEDKVAELLKGEYVASWYAPHKVAVQAYLPWDATCDAIHWCLWRGGVHTAKISRLWPGRVRWFDKNIAREKFKASYDATADDFKKAKQRAVEIEDNDFPYSLHFPV